MLFPLFHPWERTGYTACMRRPLTLLILALCLAVHSAQVSTSWRSVADAPGGGDFASYYYAARVAERGANPYRLHQLTREVVVDRSKGIGRPSPINPFFYPPPFVLLTSWVTRWDLRTAYKIWFWFDELAALASVAALAAWWRRLDPAAPLATAVAFAACSTIAGNHVVGQANLLTLLLVITGLWAQDRGRDAIGGALVGTACMLKMSPALFVAWWWLRWRWRPALYACLTAVLLSVATLPVVGWSFQLDFYRRVLPDFGSDRYNGLSVPVDLFGNHSNPNIMHQLLSTDPSHLSPLATDASRVLAGLMLLTLTTSFWRQGGSRWRQSGQLAAIAVVTLLLPVYTYEHHLVWALPAAVLAPLALLRGRLPRWSAPLVLLAVATWAAPIEWLRGLNFNLNGHGFATLALLVQEQKWLPLSWPAPAAAPPDEERTP